MIRQGNRYPEVFQFVHVTSGSFDGYVWQLLENKAGFIGQIASGEVTAREVDDVSENVLTFSEIKALASGNPKIMEKVVADTELARLEAVRHSWRTSQLSARINLSSLIEQRTRCEKDIASFQAAIKIREAHTSDKFVISLLRAADSEEMTLISDRETAGKRIRALAAGASFMITPGSGEFVEIGRYRGFAVMVTLGRTSTGLAPMVFIQVGLHQLAVNIGESDAGVTMSLDAKIRSFDTELAKAQDELKVIAQKVASLETETSRPWDHEERYLALKTKVAELEKELNVEKKAEAPAEGVESEVSIECSRPVPAAPAHQRDVPDTSAEVNAAIEAIRLLHADQHVLARFGIGQKTEPDSVEIEQPVAITPEMVKALEQKVEQAQLQLEFAKAILDAIPSGETVQLDLFGGFAATNPAVAPKKRRR